MKINDSNNLLLEVKGIYFMRIPIKKFVWGTKVLWALISSCFGTGKWVESENWSDTEYWNNGIQ